MPPFLEIGHPTLEGPGQRGVPGSPGALCGERTSGTDRRHLFLLVPSLGASAFFSNTVPCLLPFPLKSLDCEALDTLGSVSARLPGVVTLHFWPRSLPRVYTH